MVYRFNGTQYEFHWKSFSQWTRWNDDYLVFGLCGVYLMLFLFSIFMLLKFKYDTKLYPGMIMTSIVLRIIFALSVPLLYEEIVQFSPLIFFLYTLPAFFFFSCFMLILFFWGEIYMKSSIGKDITRRIWTIFRIINILMYLLASLLFALDFALGYWGSMIIYESGCYIAVSIGLPICLFFYGYYFFRSNYYTKMQSTPRHKKLLRRIGFIVMITIGFWFSRAIVVFTPLRYPTSSGYGGVAFFVLFEIIPTLILLFAFIEPRNSKETETLDETSALFINNQDRFP